MALVSLRLSGGSRERSVLETLPATLRSCLGLGNGETPLLFAERFPKGLLGVEVTVLNFSSCLGAEICEERVPSKEVVFQIILAYGYEQANWGATVRNDKLSALLPNLPDYVCSLGFQLSDAHSGHENLL